MKADNDLRNIDLQEFYKHTNNFDRIRFLLKFAILAPSTHNTQPWLLRIEDNSCKIYYDPRLQLKEADPRGRDLYISLGCCLENLIIAAKYFRVYKTVDYHCNKKNNLVAEVFFEELMKDKQVDEDFAKLATAITKRVNVRGFFKAQRIDKYLIEKIQSIDRLHDLELAFITEREKIEELATLTAEGLRLAHSRKSFRKEMSNWINSDLSKRLEGIPGYALKMPTILSFIFPTLVKLFNLGRTLSKINYKSMISAPLVCVVSAQKNDPLVWLRVGQLVQRLMLELNVAGLKTSIFVAAIEMGDLYKQVQKVLRTNYIPQFLFCAGYMSGRQRYTLRYPVEKKLLR